MKKIVTTEQKKMRNRKLVLLGIKELILFLIAVCGLIPLIWTVFISLKSNKEIFTNALSWPEQVMWINYIEAFKRIPWGRMLKNTFTEMLVALPIGMIISFMSSFGIARIRFGNEKWNETVYTYFLAGIIIPSFVLLFPVYQIVNKLGFYDNILGVALVHISWCAPMNTVIMVNALRGIPNELEEAAVIDGAGIWELLYKIYVPLTKPTLVTIFILTFIGIWNDYVLAKTMLVNNANATISMAAKLFQGLYSADYATMAAAIVILILPQLVIFSLLQKQIVDGITAGAVKG